jgi:Protein of unknown function (DUF4199)
MKYGLAGGGIVLAIFIIQLLTKLEGTVFMLMQYSVFIVLLASVYLSIQKQRSLLGGKIEFLHALRTGCSTALIISVFFAISVYIGINNVDINYEIKSMKNNGLSNAQIIDNITKMSDQATVIIQSIISATVPLLLGCLGAIGASVIMSKRS